MSAVKHTHKYVRRNNGVNKEVWVMACALPTCPHYVYMKSKLSAPQLVGKVSVCNSCNDEFILDRHSLRLSKPTCKNCRQPETIDKATNFFEELEKEIME